MNCNYFFILFDAGEYECVKPMLQDAFFLTLRAELIANENYSNALTLKDFGINQIVHKEWDRFLPLPE